MGRALAEAVAAAGETHAGGIDKDGDPLALAKQCDVLVDFSSPHALEANLDAAAATGIPMVVGTTGLEERHHFLIDNATNSIAVLQTGNTSLGVTLLAHLVKEGRTSKQIAEIMNLSVKTIEDHRKSIRKKLGIHNLQVNLRTHLLSYEK